MLFLSIKSVFFVRVCMFNAKWGRMLIERKIDVRKHDNGRKRMRKKFPIMWLGILVITLDLKLIVLGLIMLF